MKSAIVSTLTISIGIVITLACLPTCSSPQPTNLQQNNVPTKPIQVEELVITPADNPQLPARGFFMGVLPVPGQGQSFAHVYSQASDYAEFTPVWGRPTPFYNLANELGGDWGKTFVEQYTRGNGMFPIIHLSFIGENMSLKAPPGMSRATLESQQWRESYKQAAIDMIKAARPLYLSVGNEVNRWYERYGAKPGDPNGFQHYVSLYEEIHDAAKQLSPEIKVFCTFSREIVSENREADLEVLRMFNTEKIDVLVFTSYPYAVQGIKQPSDIPNDYYTRALNYMPGKLFGFSELAWAALDAFGGEQGQADFIIQASTRLTVEQGIRLHMFGWPWLHALDDNDSVGLIKRDGTERLAYGVWKELSSSGK